MILGSISKFISGALTVGKQNESLKRIRLFKLYYTSGKIEHRRFDTGKGVKSKGYLGSFYPYNSSKLSYFPSILYALSLLPESKSAKAML